MPYLYRISVAQPGTAIRLFVAVFFMIVQKSTGLRCPPARRQAVHLAAAVASADSNAVAASLRAAAWALVASGAIKAVSGLATELRSVAFTHARVPRVGASRLQVFRHVLNLDLSFHLDRRTARSSASSIEARDPSPWCSARWCSRSSPPRWSSRCVRVAVARAFLGTSSPSFSPRSWRIGWTVRMTGVSAELPADRQ